MNQPDSNKPDELHELLRTVRSRLRWLGVTVILLVMATLLSTAAVFGQLVNYFAGDAMLFGGATVGAAVLGFAFGWFAARMA